MRLSHKTQLLQITALAASAISCAPAFKPQSSTETNVRIMISREQLGAGSSARGLSDGVTDHPLPNDYCYAVQISAPDLPSIVSPNDAICGPASGIGVLLPRAFNVGDEAAVTVKIGGSRHFEVFGFPSPLGTTNGRANCGDLTVEFQNAEKPLDRHIIAKVNGSVVTGKPILFAQGTSDINPGDNLVRLDAVPLNAALASTGLPFGAPFMRGDDLVNRAPECVPPQIRTNPNRVYAASGAAIPAPIAGSQGSQLSAVTISSGLVVGSPSKAGTMHLSTGVAGIQTFRRKFRPADEGSFTPPSQ